MKKFFIIMLIFIAGCIAFADENIQKYILENGQTVVIKEVRSNPIVTMDTWIKTGSINEDDSNSGVSHFLEHLFFRGSKNHAPGEFDKILENKGGVTNAATSKDYTHYYITIPSKHFQTALSLHADMLLNPLLPRKELEKERKVVLEEISKDENSPQHVVYDNLVSMIYSQHPYKRKVIGQRSVIETIHRDNILAYYDKWYSPSNMITVIVGDVDTQDALNAVKKEFGANQKKTEKSIYPQEKPLTQQKKKVAYLQTQSGYMLIGFRGVEIDNSDTYALDVLATVLGDGKSSIFYKNIKDKLQLAESVSAANGGFRDDGIFYISAAFLPEKLSRLEDAIFDEISKLQQNGITEEQLQLAKNIIERDTYYQRESITNIAQEIGYTFVTSGDIKIYNNYIDNIKKVTAKDVKRVAEKYLGKDKSAVSIVLPENTKEIPAAVKKDNKVTSELKAEFNGTYNYILSNGANVLITPNTTNEIVAISIFAKGGNFLEKKSGIASMTASAMMKGTKNYTAQELAQILEDNGIKINPSTRSDAFMISILTTRQQYEKTMDLLSEIVNNATFPEYEVEKIKNEKLNAIKRSRDIPLNLAVEGYKHLIFENSPYSNSTIILEKNIPTITKSDIAEYYSGIFAPQNLVISINGNVDAEKTISRLGQIFNNQTGKKFYYSEKSNLIKPIVSKKEMIKKVPTTNTDWIFIAWQTDGLNNKKDYATLNVIDSLLGTGMSSRLFKNLRDQEGLAYQLGSGYSANVLRGAFVLYIGTNPETYEKALAGLKHEIKILKTEFVGTKELKDAKDKLLGHYILSQETNMDKATTVGWYEASIDDFKFTKEYEELINSVTEADIIRVANKYFKDSNYVLSAVKNK